MVELFGVVRDAAAGAAQSEGRTHDDGIADALGEVDGVFGALDNFGGNGRLADGAHGVFKGLSVLGHVDGVDVGAQKPHAVFVQKALFGQLHGQIEAGLAAQGGKNAVGLFFDDDPLDDIQGQRFDVDFVGHGLVGHDGGGIGIDEHHIEPRRAQGLAGLGAGVIKFRRLSDDDGAGADDEYFF